MEGITLRDALMALKYSMKIPQGDFAVELADCDGQEGVTLRDALLILKCSMRIPVEFQ